VIIRIHLMQSASPNWKRNQNVRCQRQASFVPGPTLEGEPGFKEERIPGEFGSVPVFLLMGARGKFLAAESDGAQSTFGGRVVHIDAAVV
jgi:hypothetical protein